MARTDDDLLQGLLQQRYAGQSAPPSARPAAPSIPLDQEEPQQRQRQRRRNYGGLYELLMGKGALLSLLGLVGYAWYVGASFTLQAFAGWGYAIAAWGLAAWLIPGVISLIETGTMLLRSRHPTLWLLWLIVVGIDAYTTAAGILDQYAGHVVLGVAIAPNPSGWFLTMLVGLAFALGPEPIARVLIGELAK